MPDSQTTSKKTKILLIDDDSFLLSIYSNKFAKSGFDVVTAANAMDALKKIKEGLNPDVMLIDVAMPEMTGLELLEKIRNEKLVPQATTVIMLTNEAEQESIEKAKSFGIDGYIVKATSVPSEVIDMVTNIHNTANKNRATKSSTT